MSRNLARTICTLPVMLALATPTAHARATDPDSCIAPPELLVDLIDWIGEETGYDVTRSRATPPRVAFCVAGETIPYESAEIVVESDLQGAYDASGRLVYLVWPWDATNPYDVSRLLHELVHDLQMQNGSWDCPQQMEWQAYQLQQDWLAGQGVDAGFNWFTIYLASRCPASIHP